MLIVDDKLSSMLAPIVEMDPKALSRNATDYFENEIGNFLSGHPLKDPSDECSGNGSDIKSDCNTYAKSISALELADYQTGVNARTALSTAISNWAIALQTYQAAVASAQLDLELADQNAQDTFDKAYNDDSKSRVEFLTATMKLSGVTARQNYETAVEAAANTLAGDAATLIAAYSAFVTSTINAPLTALNTKSLAEQTFWQSVETKRDS